MKLFLHNYAEILSALICTICLFVKPSVTNKWFTGFLWLTVFIELFAKLLRYHPAYKMAMYNVFGVVECGFYLLYLGQISSRKSLEVLLRILITAIISFSIVWWLFIENINDYSEVVSMIASLFILFATLLTLYSFMKQSSDVPKLKVYMLILIGLLVFYTGNFLPDASAGSSFSKTHTRTFLSVYRLVNGYLNVFMYGCFTIAFLVELFHKSRDSMPAG